MPRKNGEDGSEQREFLSAQRSVAETIPGVGDRARTDPPSARRRILDETSATYPGAAASVAGVIQFAPKRATRWLTRSWPLLIGPTARRWTRRGGLARATGTCLSSPAPLATPSTAARARELAVRAQRTAAADADHRPSTSRARMTVMLSHWNASACKLAPSVPHRGGCMS
jgi:hypothetical protein